MEETKKGLLAELAGDMHTFDPRAWGPKGITPEEMKRRFRNPDQFNVEVAALELGRIGNRRSAPLLARMLEDHDPLVRAAAAEALGKIGDRSTIAALERALHDRDYMVRWDAVRALGAMKARSSFQISSARLTEAAISSSVGNTSAAISSSERGRRSSLRRGSISLKSDT